MTLPPSKRAAPGRVRQAPWVRLLLGLVSIAVLTGGAIGLSLWWEDRPLRAIEEALDRKEFAQALDLANDHLKEFPNHFQALDQKARALAGLDRWTEAGRLFERIGAKSFASQRAWSQALLHSERWSEVLPLLKRFNGLSPDDPDLLHELAACEAKLGHFDESIAVAKRLTRISGHEDRGHLLLGTLHYKRGNNREAIEAWKPILKRNPEAADLQLTAAEFFAAMGRALLDDGQAAAARPYLERAVRLAPTADARNSLAEACEQLGDSPQAVELWRQVVVGNSIDREAREGLARTALERRDADDARRWLEPLLDRDGLTSSTAYLMQRAALLAGDKATATQWDERVQSLRQREKKMSALDQAVREAPQSFWARVVRAHRFASEGNTYQALLMAQELLDQSPDQAFVRQLVGALRAHEPLPSLDLIPYDQF